MENFIINLDKDDLLRVTGPDSSTFLQGQLTCDISQLNAQSSSLGAVCNTKGRVISAFRIFMIGEDYYLALPGGMLEQTSTHLDRYRVFYKTEFSTAGDNFCHLGLAGPDAAIALSQFFSALPQNLHGCVSNEHGIIIQVSTDEQKPRYECWLSNDCANKLHNKLSEAPLSRWLLLNIQQHLWLPTVKQGAAYTPEELNLDLLGAVSFDKGCYTGQEIVARMHYRGKARKRLIHFRTTAADDIDSQLFSQLTENVDWTISDEKKPDKSAMPVLVVLENEAGFLEGLAVLNTARLPDSPFLSAPDINPLPIHLLLPEVR